jgi:hypothetical protein
MKRILVLSNLLLAFVLLSCSSDDDGDVAHEFVVAFENPSASFTEEEESKEIKLSFSQPAVEDGTAIITFTAANAEYGTHFTTDPAADQGSLEVPISSGSSSATFTFNKLQNPIEGTQMSVEFKLSSISNANSVIQGNTSLEVSFTPSAALGGSMSPESGGSTYPNQVYIDLSSQTQTVVRRDTWELAFFSGSQNRVILNPALRVSAAKLDQFNDLNDVNSSTEFNPPLVINRFDLFTQTYVEETVTSVEEYKAGVKVSYSMYEPYVDTADGQLETTAFDAVSETDSENKVYLFYMGTEIPTEAAEPGSINTGTVDRGWYKVRVLNQGGAYVLQYASLDATEFKEITIEKDAQLNAVAFSMTDDKIVSVEPPKENWDLNISGVFATEIGTTYSDFVLHNTLGGVSLYEVVIDQGVKSYADFSIEDVDESLLNAQDRSVIGSGWRSTTGPSSSSPVAKDDRYYVLKDVDGNYYKIRFTAVVSESGERGYPSFEYSLL